MDVPASVFDLVLSELAASHRNRPAGAMATDLLSKMAALPNYAEAVDAILHGFLVQQIEAERRHRENAALAERARQRAVQNQSRTPVLRGSTERSQQRAAEVLQNTLDHFASKAVDLNREQK